MRISPLVSFLKTYKKVFILGTFFIGIFIFSTQWVFAEDGLSEENSKTIVAVLNGIITAIAAVLSMVTSFISIFLYPGWVNGTMFNLQDYLKEIWILVSNVIYFVFAGILIAIAFMNIIGKGEGTWELKQAMPKFIVWVLIVPFSWFFVQFVISISSILTVGVLTLPYDVFQEKPLYSEALDKAELGNSKICKDIVISFSSSKPWSLWGSSAPTVPISENGVVNENIKCASASSLVTIREILEGTGWGDGLDNSIFGIISIYTYGILRIDQLDTIKDLDLTSIKWMADLVFKILFDLLFIIVYFLLMVALFLALLVRGIRLWIYMMLSPAFWLLYFFGKWSEGVGWDSNNFSIKEFIALAMVPVYVSAALAFGLVFILVATEGIQVETTTNDKSTLNAWGFSITILWAHGDSDSSEKSVIWKLIIEMFGIIILWIAVMAALKTSKTTEAITAPIAKFGEDVWKLAAAAPTYAPIIPTGKGGFQSAQSMSKISGNITSTVQNTSTDRATDFMTGYWIWWDASQMTAAAGKIADKIDTLDSGDSKPIVAEEFKKLFKEWIKVETMVWNAEAKRVLMSTAKHMGIEDEVKKINLSSPQGFTDAVALLDHHWQLNQYWDLIEWHNDKTAGNLKFGKLNEYIEAKWTKEIWWWDIPSWKWKILTIKPTINDIRDRDSNVIKQEVKIDNDTTLYVKWGKLEDTTWANSTQRLVAHIGTMWMWSDGKGVMKPEDFEKILVNMWITDDTEQKRIVGEIDEEFFI